jgi:poly-beta-1,6-N-acetyl-D-glucosamine biosynthesis protein PgaD
MSADIVELPVGRDEEPPAPIINLPHLVGVRQRLGALAFSLACWLYFLLPVAVLAGWLAGFSDLAEEVVALGGWKRFQALMGMSGKAIVVLAAAWLVWSLYLLIQRRPADETEPTIDDAALSAFFGVPEAELGKYRAARLVTIHFEEDGRYRELVPQDVEPVTATIEAEGAAIPLAKAS